MVIGWHFAVKGQHHMHHSGFILILNIIIVVRDLPVTQFYTNTLLQRSRVRQTDEL